MFLKILKFPVHPFLFGIYPILTLLASNISQVLFTDTRRSFVISLGLCVALLTILYFVTRDSHKAGLLASVGLILFFLYGHVYELVYGLSLGPFLIGRTLVVFPIFVFLLLTWAWYILKRVSVPYNLTLVFNIMGMALVIFPLYSTLSYYVQSERIRASQKITDIPAAISQRFNGHPPTVYYIILDMRARSDVLKAIYGYDDSEFINSLKQKGFYIGVQSTSNYSSTLQSISSSLNMVYINDLGDTYGTDFTNREPLGLLIQQNKVMEIFKSAGYQIGAFQTNDFYTEFPNADVYIKPSKDQIRQYQDIWALNSFEGILVKTSMLRTMYDLSIIESETAQIKTIETPYKLHRLTIINSVERLPEFAYKKNPYFVFLHIVSPHPPYVFGPNGEEIRHNQPFSLSGPGRQNSDPTHIKMYVNQLEYIDKIVLQAIDKILTASETPPIIIIQSDHGPVSYNGENEVDKGNMKEQHAILNAYYFPGQKYDLLYPSISPVNSFRVVFNTFLGENYEILRDQNFFIPHGRPYEFIDVTDRVQTDPLKP